MNSKNFVEHAGLNMIGFVDNHYVVELDVQTWHLNKLITTAWIWQ